MTEKELVKAASEARQNAYTPFSGFKVGAALLTEEGKVYKGCNIEVSTYSGTLCAERNAIFKAVSEGERHFKAIAVTAGTDDYIYPCGICRQVLAEFCKDDLKVICSNAKGEYKIYELRELLPQTFRLKDYKEGNR